MSNKVFCLAETKVAVARSMSFGDRESNKILRKSISFKRSDSSNKMVSSEVPGMERSLSFKHWEPQVTKIEGAATDKQAVEELKIQANFPAPIVELPQRQLLEFSSPRPLCELDAAATTLQKVYKSYRTRRNLADCAVLVEEFWWRALDFASLRSSSVSFFNVEKPEPAVSKWARAKKRLARVGKGLSKDEKAQQLALRHWLEAIDPRHRYGHNLHLYYDIWFASESTQPFFYWLDVGDGREVNLEECSRNKLQQQCITYLGPVSSLFKSLDLCSVFLSDVILCRIQYDQPLAYDFEAIYLIAFIYLQKEREGYEVIVDDGKLVYKKSEMPVNTTEGSKWIFVLSTSRSLYVGKKNKGTFQHSSFLAGGATTSAGRLVAKEGILQAIWPYSGHYLPTEENFKEFISFLEDNNVDLTNVKKCSVDDDDYNLSNKGHASDLPEVLSQEAIKSKVEASKCDPRGTDQRSEKPAPTPVARQQSRKWATAAGARISCVRDYPSDLQSRALEQVNLSPRVVLSPITNNFNAPIPSPRPSPKVRVSPRVQFMGIPTPAASPSQSRLPYIGIPSPKVSLRLPKQKTRTA
ncbi:IQ domain-containing protein IQM1-like isoform X1 [Zingiber officinale]|uniref:IQ domain-containing protein IQM1-like isoform X1 n=1 Tax=Zingiber officinale TaxID=94328 RepID=UPI001C4A7B8E|nr:IQ domain-containing protein IQM1-like isoform X1 [Zingiber officinale]